MVSVKISRGSELRRFRLPDQGNDWASVEATIRSLFGSTSDAPLALQYTDADGDAITISSTLELEEAIQDTLAQNGNVLRLSLTETADPSDSFVVVAPAPRAPANLVQSEDKGKAPVTAQQAESVAAPEAVPTPTTPASEVKPSPVKIEIKSSAPVKTVDSDPPRAPPPKEDGPAPQPEATSAPAPDDPFAAMQALLEEFVPQFMEDILGASREQQQSGTESSPDETSAGPAEDEPKHVHWGVECDHCHSVVVGRRFKCRSCRNYDLCGDCYTVTPAGAPFPAHDPAHEFAHIPHPLSFLPPHSGEFATRFSQILPGLMSNMARQTCGAQARGCPPPHMRAQYHGGCHARPGPHFMFGGGGFPF